MCTVAKRAQCAATEENTYKIEKKQIKKTSCLTTHVLQIITTQLNTGMHCK